MSALVFGQTAFRCQRWCLDRLPLDTWRYLAESFCDWQLVSQSVNQLVSKSVSQSVSTSVNQPVNQSVRESISQSLSQSLSQSTSSACWLGLLVRSFPVASFQAPSSSPWPVTGVVRLPVAVCRSYIQIHICWLPSRGSNWYSTGHTVYCCQCSYAVPARPSGKSMLVVCEALGIDGGNVMGICIVYFCLVRSLTEDIRFSETADWRLDAGFRFRPLHWSL